MFLIKIIYIPNSRKMPLTTLEDIYSLGLGVAILETCILLTCMPLQTAIDNALNWDIGGI